MKLPWTNLTGASPTAESVGWGTSLVVHAVGAAVASAAFYSVATSDRALPGDRLQTEIELTAEFYEPEVPPSAAIQPSDPVLVVMPARARMAARSYTQASPDVSQPTTAELAWAERLLAEPVPVSTQPERPSPGMTLALAGSPPESDPPHRAARSAGVRAVRAKSSSMPAPPRTPTATVQQTPPQLRDHRPPDYPLAAYRSRLEGIVLLRVAVGSDGRVAGVEILQSSGHLILDAAALRTVRSWQYVPASRDGRPVAATIRQPVRFTLRK